MIGRNLLVVTLVAQLGGCGFAVKHPAATAAIVAGTMGLGTCEMQSDNQKACFIIGASTAAFLGLVAGIALWTMGGNEEEVQTDPALENPEDGPQDLPPEKPEPKAPPAKLLMPTQTPIPRLPTTPPPAEPAPVPTEPAPAPAPTAPTPTTPAPPP